MCVTEYISLFFKIKLFLLFPFIYCLTIGSFALKAQTFITSFFSLNVTFGHRVQ